MRSSILVLALAPIAAFAALNDAPSLMKRSCNNNLGRRLSRYSAEASAFCSTFTLSSATAGQSYPSFLHGYTATPSRISSACSCVATASAVKTTTMNTSSSGVVSTTSMIASTTSSSMSMTTSSSTSSTVPSSTTASSTSSSTLLTTTRSSTTSSSSSPSSTTSSAGTTTSSGVEALPSTFTWSSTDVLIGPKSDSYNLSALKDPSIVYIDGVYHVFASTAKSAGYSLVYLNFTDFNQAQSATFNYLDQTPIGSGYRAAPEVFYFAPQKLWYLVYQNGNAAYSTNTAIGNPAGWTAPTNFYSAEPDIIVQNIGSGYWVDMWNVCDDSMCYLFSSDDNGHLYRSETTLANFPNGYGNTVIALEDTTNKYNLFEASNVYSIGGGNYLLLVEAIGATGERYFRSWTSTGLTETWTPLAATEQNPFLGQANVVFANGNAWTKSFSHGEVIRTSVDQTMTISPCKLRFLYQGINPALNTGDYNSLPWRLALVTQTNSAC